MTDTPRGPVALDCAHGPVQPPANGPSGYAETREGKKLCYPCADAALIEELKTVGKFTAYLNVTCTNVTAYSGKVIGRVTRYDESRKAKRCYVRVIDVHGTRWHGVGPVDNGTYVSLVRTKVKEGK